MSDTGKSNAFSRLVTIASLTKLGDLLISTRTTLPWIMSSLGAPGWMLSLLVPIRESGSLIPQWSIQQYTRDRENRVPLWRFGLVGQGIAIFLIAAAMTIAEPMLAGLGVILSLVFFSLSRALCSLTMKDMQGELISKGRRGRLVGTATMLSGALTLVSAWLLYESQKSYQDAVLYGLVIAAAIIFLLALLPSLSLVAKIDTKDDKQADKQQIWQLLSQESALRHIVISRSLLLHGALITPFMVSQTSSTTDAFSLPVFIVASALAVFLSSYFWGWLADKSAVNALRLATLISIGASTGFILFQPFQSWVLPVCWFFLLAFGYAGVRTGRKTYLLDIAEGSKRTRYVAVANTLVGYILLVLGGVYALLYSFLGATTLILMTLTMAVGLIHSYWLPKEKSASDSN